MSAMGTKSVADASPLSEGLAVTVKVHMARRDMTRKRLVELAGRSEPYWSKRLSGTSGFNLADVEGLAAAFGLAPDQLVREALLEAERLSEEASAPETRNTAEQPASIQELKQQRLLEQAQPATWAADDKPMLNPDDDWEPR